MIFRNSKPGDFHQGKWNGLGGKLEADESAIEAAQRELFEESGLDLGLEQFRALGTVHFPNFKAHRCEDWLVTLFSVSLDGVVLDHAQKAVVESFPKKMAEGELHWIEEDQVLSLNLWPGDALFLPAFLEGKFQTGAIWYKDGAVVKSWFQLG